MRIEVLISYNIKSKMKIVMLFLLLLDPYVIIY
jgi:hypothetical protein